MHGTNDDIDGGFPQEPECFGPSVCELRPQLVASKGPPERRVLRQIIIDVKNRRVGSALGVDIWSEVRHCTLLGFVYFADKNERKCGAIAKICERAFLFCTPDN
jgi:hypothetical protein